MLCPDCSHMSLSIIRGTCAECGGDTVSDDHLLCEKCSLDLDMCQVCEDDLGISAQAAAINPGVYMVRKNMKDTGSTIKLKLGDELHITLDVSNGYDFVWQDDGSHDERIVCHQSSGAFIESDGGSWGKGYQTLVFKAAGVGIVQLSLAEVPMRSRGGYMGLQSMSPSGVTWKATVQVK